MISQVYAEGHDSLARVYYQNMFPLKTQEKTDIKKKSASVDVKQDSLTQMQLLKSTQVFKVSSLGCSF